MRIHSNNKLCPILSAKIRVQSIEEVPVIIQFNENSEDLRNRVSSLASNYKFELSIINGFAGHLSTDIIYDLSTNPEVKFISFDSKIYTLLDVATPSMEAYFPHDQGYEGEDICVAIIDTGVATHEDLIRPINRIVAFKDFVNNKSIPYDDNGHGTHVTGIIAGNGFSSKGKYVGVAPKANIFAIKALDSSGGGSISDIISALAYVIEVKDIYNIKVVNISLGTPATNSCENDPLCKAVSKVNDAGLIVVTAAGNSGPNSNTILSPGISKDAITVGAVDNKRTIDTSDDTIASFSSRGPTKDGLVKPDLVASGVNIRSLSNTKLDSYTSLSGTSMATPLVTGSIALLFNKYKDLSPADVKGKIMKACIDLKDSKENQGAGMLNLRLLFDDSFEDNKNPPKSPDSGRDAFNNIIIIPIIIFLPDSWV